MNNANDVSVLARTSDNENLQINNQVNGSEPKRRRGRPSKKDVSKSGSCRPSGTKPVNAKQNPAMNTHTYSLRSRKGNRDGVDQGAHGETNNGSFNINDETSNPYEAANLLLCISNNELNNTPVEAVQGFGEGVDQLQIEEPRQPDMQLEKHVQEIYGEEFPSRPRIVGPNTELLTTIETRHNVAQLQTTQSASLEETKITATRDDDDDDNQSTQSASSGSNTTTQDDDHPSTDDPQQELTGPLSKRVTKEPKDFEDYIKWSSIELDDDDDDDEI